ncbi:RHS domain-containing protein [Streptomyces sp. HB-N217]|nr:RHS domain-containing protein [Streptomyces sp. HB-N217]
MVGHRPSDWHVLDLDKDPTPGDPQRVRTLAKTLHDFADDVSEALRLVKGMAGESTLAEWAGKSATVFKDEFSGVPKNLKKLEKSYGMCGDALADFWPKLERAQALADKALIKAREARDDLSSAQSKLSSADSWVTRASKEADKYKDDPTGSKSDADKPDEAKVRAATRDVQHAKTAQTNAQSAVDSAQGALGAAKKMAADARKMRDDAAREAKNKIDEASDAGIQNRSWWEDIGDWFSDNWDSIVAVCKVVVAIVGIIAMVIGGPILGAIVLVAALVVLADTLYKYSKGQASLWDVGLAALDCIPGMKGLTTLGGLAKGLKGGMAAMKGIKGGLKGMGLALRGLGKNARAVVTDGAKGAYNRVKSVVRSKGSDPIDMATGAMYLPQTDVTLPGLLPLTFTRRVASDYRCGWWFGPTWSSTIDQRLEIDEHGIIFVTADGLLLTYPHPSATNASVMPQDGPRRPLTRMDDGTYRIHDLITGRTHHFSRVSSEGIAVTQCITDRNNHTISFDYDAHGAPIAMRHSGGYHLRITTEDGRVTAISLVGAAEDGTDITLKQYGYTNGNLTETINSSGLPLRFTYDDRLRITSWTDTNARGYRYSYDEHDRCVAEGGDAGHITITLEYDGSDPRWPGCRTTTMTAADGAVTRFIVNGNSQVIAEVDALGYCTRTSYDEYHHVLAHTDAQGSITRSVNDAVGRPLIIRYPDGEATRLSYDGLGCLSAITLPDGTCWKRQYDERGNCVAVTDPTEQTYRYTYDDSGRLTGMTDPCGATTRVRCTAAGLVAEVTDPLGNSVGAEHDAFGRVSLTTNQLGAQTRRRWTAEGLLSRVVAPDGTEQSWEYDGEGNCIRHTDSLGAVTRYEYTHFDLLAARTGPDGTRYRFEHDASLRLTKVSASDGLSWEYTYDRNGRLTAETDFDGRRVTYKRNAVGRVVERTNPLGQSISYEYGVQGWLTAKHVDGETTNYEYDRVGRRLRVRNRYGEISWERDPSGKPISETVNGNTMAFRYDAAGRRVERTTPTGTLARYSYDAAGRAASLTTSDHNVVFSYDAAGREVVRRLGDTLELTQGWDSVDRLINQTVTAAHETLQHRSYVYRADNALVGINDPTSGAVGIELDDSCRVTEINARDWNERYVYDTAGEQAMAAWPSHDQDVQGARAYSGKRLTRAGSVRFEYDGAGRVIARRKARLSRKPDVWRYEWDGEDRLTAVTVPDGSMWRYRYDPFGRRTSKEHLASDGVTVTERTHFTWDGASVTEQTTTAAHLPHPVTLTWDYDGLIPVAQTERLTDQLTQQEIDSRFFAIVTDLVGTPTELIDESGNVAWRSRKTLWGVTTWQKGSTTYTPLRFPGHYYDPETGLNYNYHRYYDPETARYATPDPLGLAPSPNPATYVNNPYSQVDPLGLSPYENTMPDQLAQELADAERLGVRPLRVGDGGFDEAVNSGTVKWAVDEQGELVIIPKHVNGVELKHPVLTGGRPVQSAGEAEIAGEGGVYIGLDLNNNSGHYRPSIESLQIGKDAFERAGIAFP